MDIQHKPPVFIPPDEQYANSQQEPFVKNRSSSYDAEANTAHKSCSKT